MASEADLNDRLQAIDVLTVPVGREWLTGRVTALLTAYFGASLPSGVLAVELSDWLAELERFPEWAVRDAIRWWRGAENQDRHRKPQPGDIAAAARREMDIIDLARGAVHRYRHGPIIRDRPSEPDAPRCSPEAAAEIMAGFKLKGFSNAD